MFTLLKELNYVRVLAKLTGGIAFIFQMICCILIPAHNSDLFKCEEGVIGLPLNFVDIGVVSIVYLFDHAILNTIKVDDAICKRHRRLTVHSVPRFFS